MRRILVSCAVVGVLALPAAAIARAQGGGGRPGYVVVSKAVGNGGVNGSPVVTVVVQGFVLGRASQEARVEIYQLPSAGGGGGSTAVGLDVSKAVVHWRRFTGTRYSGSAFRFRAIGGAYRVVVRGSGVSLFAGGHGTVVLHGSSVYRAADGAYAIGGRAFRSLPARPLDLPIGRG